MRAARCLWTMVAASVFLANSGLADDIIIPAWRGQPGATLQRWSFDSSDNPATPEVTTIPDATASATMVPMVFSDGWYGTILGRNGVWGDLERLTLQIDSAGTAGHAAEIWVQVTYYDGPNDVPVVSVAGATYIGGETHQLEQFGFAHWYLQQSMWQMDTHPNPEIVEITTGVYGMTIDAIVIDRNTDSLPPACHTPAQDVDGDTDVDLTDFGVFSACFNGPNRPYAPGGDPVLCACLDQDDDQDVDLSDFSVFSQCFNGPNRPPAGDCP